MTEYLPINTYTDPPAVLTGGSVPNTGDPVTFSVVANPPGWVDPGKPVIILMIDTDKVSHPELMLVTSNTGTSWTASRLFGASNPGSFQTHANGSYIYFPTTKELLEGNFAAITHASEHINGGDDELEIADLPTAETDTSKVLAPDGAGGVEFRAEAATATDATISTSDITTNNVTSSKHGFAPKSPADATKFLNGAATPAYAQVKDSDLATTDITTNNVSTSKHGFAPKGDGNAAHYLDGSGAYSTPAGSGMTNPMTTQDDIIIGGASGTPARLAKGTDSQVLTVDPTTHHLVWATPSRQPFKHTILKGNGNKTTTSATFVAIDTTNLPYLTLAGCAVGDIIECKFTGQWYTSTSTTRLCALDVEVDRPTSANERVGEGCDTGTWVETFDFTFRHFFNMTARYVVNEAGTHGFRPMWLTSGSTLTLANGTSGNDDSVVMFSVENLGPVTA